MTYFFLFKKIISSSSELLSNNSLFGGQVVKRIKSRARSKSDLSLYDLPTNSKLLLNKSRTGAALF